MTVGTLNSSYVNNQTVRNVYMWMQRGSIVVIPSACHAADRGSIPGPGKFHYLVKYLALNIRDCLSLCLSEETLKAAGPFYLVSKGLCQGK